MPWLALVAVLVAGAAVAGAWVYQDDVVRLVGLAEPSAEREPAAAAAQPSAPEPQNAAAAEQQPTDVAATRAATEEESSKFTQRLMPNGQEVDSGRAEDEPQLGEGTSIAQATEAGLAERSEAEAQAAPSAEGAVPVGQEAFFYEEGTAQAEASREEGSVVWSLIQESPGGNLPPEAAIHAEAVIPAKRLQLKMTIRRNVDQSLPASHILELIFLTPTDFAGGGIDTVSRVTMKRLEGETGSALAGIPAKIADGFFLFALSDRPADVQANMALLQRLSWIDIPVVYSSGRRALITLEKGVPGGQAFREALTAWQTASSQ